MKLRLWKFSYLNQDVYLHPQMNRPGLVQTLNTCLPGEEGVICGVEKHPLAPKLLEMGLVNGAGFKVLFQAPFGGPMAVRIGNYVLSMRLEEAGLVHIELSKNSAVTSVP